jgi:hypothetical protein
MTGQPAVSETFLAALPSVNCLPAFSRLLPMTIISTFSALAIDTISRLRTNAQTESGIHASFL